MKKYEEMTVKELKEVSKGKGLQVCTHGHKFTKQELINNLLLFNNNGYYVDSNENKVEETIQEEQKKHERVKTLEEAKKKYCRRKKDKVYDNMNVGNELIFIEKLITKYSNIEVEKLRTAIVVGINRKKELVKVETKVGKEYILQYDEILYIKTKEGDYYPADLKCLLWEQKQDYLNHKNS